MSQNKVVTLTMNPAGEFKIDGNIAPIEIIGFLEYAKAVLLRDAVPAAPVKELTDTPKMEAVKEDRKGSENMMTPGPEGAGSQQ